MNWIMKLAIKLNMPILNYGIYEQDIKYFGGKVVYLGNILTESGRSKVEEAIVTLGDVSCHVYMARFRDGSAALQYFVIDGAIWEDEMYPEAEKFLRRILALTEKDSCFKAHVCKRRMKQGFTLAAQILCTIISFRTSNIFWNTEFSVVTTIMYFGAPIMIVVWGMFYKYYRLAEVKTKYTDGTTFQDGI